MKQAGQGLTAATFHSWYAVNSNISTVAAHMNSVHATPSGYTCSSHRVTYARGMLTSCTRLEGMSYTWARGGEGMARTLCCCMQSAGAGTGVQDSTACRDNTLLAADIQGQWSTCLQ